MTNKRERMTDPKPLTREEVEQLRFRLIQTPENLPTTDFLRLCADWLRMEASEKMRCQVCYAIAPENEKDWPKTECTVCALQAEVARLRSALEEREASWTLLKGSFLANEERHSWLEKEVGLLRELENVYRGLKANSQIIGGSAEPAYILPALDALRHEQWPSR